MSYVSCVSELSLTAVVSDSCGPGHYVGLCFHLQALLKNARQSRRDANSLAELSPRPEDEGVSSKGLVNGWFSTPAHQIYVQAYDEGVSNLQRHI